MQPALVGHPILSAAHFVGQHLTIWNTLFALVQCLIGIGLLLPRHGEGCPARIICLDLRGLVVW